MRSWQGEKKCENRLKSVSRLIAESTCMLQFFEDIGEVKFEIAADAFATFRVKGVMCEICASRV